MQNTYTNATKLLTAAEELAHTGECAPDEIYAVAQELEAHVSSFAARVEQRRRRLDLAVVFYTHEKEVFLYGLIISNKGNRMCYLRFLIELHTYTHIHIHTHTHTKLSLSRNQC